MTRLHLGVALIVARGLPSGAWGASLVVGLAQEDAAAASGWEGLDLGDLDLRVLSGWDCQIVFVGLDLKH